MPTLGDRMKKYEKSFSGFLPQRMPMIIRVNGKAFHSFTRKFSKPWDEDIRDGLTSAAQSLIKEIQGAKLAYLQSDEISVLITDYDSLQFEPWLNKSIQKISSVSASIATMSFNLSMLDQDHRHDACFDARCFVLPKEEVCNYFIWRQQDAIRNSIQGLGQKHFPHKELQRKNCNNIKLMLKETGVSWEKCKTWQKQGWCVLRKTIVLEENKGSKTQLPYLHTKTTIEPDWRIPDFIQDRVYINRHVFLEEEKEKSNAN